MQDELVDLLQVGRDVRRPSLIVFRHQNVIIIGNDTFVEKHDPVEHYGQLRQGYVELESPPIKAWNIRNHSQLHRPGVPSSHSGENPFDLPVFARWRTP